mgnify:CR=1 FL=1
MKRLLGGLLESAHVLALALLFGAAALLTRLTTPALLPDGLGLSDARTTRLFEDIARLIGSPGRAVAAVALVAAILAPYVRDDARKALAWARVVLAAGALAVLIAGWGPEGVEHWESVKGVSGADVERHATKAEQLKLRADAHLTPWSALCLLTGTSLALAAFQVFSAGKAKPAKGA